MTLNPSGAPLRRSLLLASSAAALALPAGTAMAQGGSQPVATGSTSLEAQVDTLTSLVKQLADRDQALEAQLQALQAKVDQQPIAAVAQNATPVAGQTAESRPDQNAAHFPARSGGPPEIAAAGVAQPRVTQNDTHHFTLQSQDGLYSIGLVGVVQFDTGGYLGFHPDSPHAGPQGLSDGVNARRARIGLAGTAGGSWSYGFVYDGGNSQDTTPRGIETAQVVYNGIKGLALELGYSNTFFTLDQSTSSNDLLFLERATPSNIATNFNTGDNRANAGFRLFGDRYWIGAYATGPSSSTDSHTQTGERLGAFERAAFQVLKGPDYSMHLGVGVDELLRAPNAGNGTPDTLSLSDQPELRIDPTSLLSTGTIGTAANRVTGADVFDVETAATWKNFFYQGEYYHYIVDREGLDDESFNGGYAELAWVLTGENHRYNPQAAAYYRVFPTHPFSLRTGGLGAFELAARVSYIDMISNYTPRLALSAQPDAINGGRQASYSLALNWYPNDILRFMLDFNHVDFDKSITAAATGAPLGTNVGAHFSAVALRSQVVF